jgi:glycosyltransferase involved in cell wall biosynthesis
MPEHSEGASRKDARKVALVHQAHPLAGGAATYERNLSDLAREIVAESEFELLEFFLGSRESFKSDRKPTGTTGSAHRYSKDFIQLLHILLLATPTTRKIMSFLGVGVTQLERQLKQLAVDIVYFSSPNPLALGVYDLPIITTVWDLGHRDLPSYPEFSSRGRWLAREYYFRNTVSRSEKVVTDSAATGLKLEEFYGLLPDNWVPLGLLPKATKPSQNFGLLPNKDYIIYPAQKWRHKNHEVLYRALRLLREEGQEIFLVETGADKGYAARLRKIAKKLGIDDLVLDLGFVDKADLSLLIKNSKGLVMPSLLGPTNLPPLEALALGVPVAVSDVHQFDEDLMRHLTLCGADSPSDWLVAIKAMILTENGSSPELVFRTVNAAELLRSVVGGVH